MIPIQAYLIASHLDDLQREASAARLARLVREAAFTEGDFSDGSPRPPRRPDVRRTLARAAVQLSLLADGAARRLDPGVQPSDAFGVGHGTGARPAAGVAGR